MLETNVVKIVDLSVLVVGLAYSAAALSFALLAAALSLRTSSQVQNPGSGHPRLTTKSQAHGMGTRTRVTSAVISWSSGCPHGALLPCALTGPNVSYMPAERG